MTHRYIEELTRDECMRLLGTKDVGWLTHCDNDRPRAVVVNYTVVSGEVVVRSGYGTKLTAAARHLTMTLAVDELRQPSRTGWSVTVTGQARLLGDRLVNPDLRAPEPWVPHVEELFLTVPCEHITGRRIIAWD
jgi:nitroimidazol reductase NimA-like FMN-containing flavoprotein (pyridoxamine 5'-phosphate oxidase superfamily)